MPENIYSCCSFRSVSSTVIFNLMLLHYIEPYLRAHILSPEKRIKRRYQWRRTEKYCPVIHPKELPEKNKHMSCRSDGHLPGGTFQSSLSTHRFSDSICTQGVLAALRLFRTKETNPRSPPQSTAQVGAPLQIALKGKAPGQLTAQSLRLRTDGARNPRVLQKHALLPENYSKSLVIKLTNT